MYIQIYKNLLYDFFKLLWYMLSNVDVPLCLHLTHVIWLCQGYILVIVPLELWNSRTSALRNASCQIYLSLLQENRTKKIIQFAGFVMFHFNSFSALLQFICSLIHWLTHQKKKIIFDHLFYRLAYRSWEWAINKTDVIHTFLMLTLYWGRYMIKKQIRWGDDLF